MVWVGKCWKKTVKDLSDPFFSHVTGNFVRKTVSNKIPISLLVGPYSDRNKTNNHLLRLLKSSKIHEKRKGRTKIMNFQSMVIYHGTKWRITLKNPNIPCVLIHRSIFARWVGVSKKFPECGSGWNTTIPSNPQTKLRYKYFPYTIKIIHMYILYLHVYYICIVALYIQ